MRECVVLLRDIKLDKTLTFINESVLLSDERRKKHTCYVCMEKFATARQLAKHRHLHTDSESDAEDDLFEEDVALKLNKNLNSHKPSKSSNLSNKLKENINKCKESAGKIDNTSVDNSKENLPTENCDSKIETPFKCDTCQIFFETSDDAKLHKATTRCKFSCKLCKRKFNTLYAFVVHVMQHKVNIVKNQIPTTSAYLCTLCDKSFDDCFQLRRHEIITHKVKPSNDSTVQLDNKSATSESSLPQCDDITEDANKDENSKPPSKVATEDESSNSNHNNIDVDESTEISCELCYDVFHSTDELDKHMAFHKQLENKSETIVIEDDDDEEVEIIENKKDAHEIITTIKKGSKKNPILINKYATLTPIYSTPSILEPSVSTSSNTNTSSTASNQMLSAKIKEMLTPTSEKSSKTILLDPKEKLPNLIPVHKLKKKCKTYSRPLSSLAPNSNFELRKTGPLSYSFFYKGANTTATTTASSIILNPTTASMSTPSTSLNTVASNISNNTGTIQPVGLANTNYTFVLTNLPNLGPPNSSTSITNPTTSGNSLIDSNLQNTLSVVTSIANCPIVANSPNVVTNPSHNQNTLTSTQSTPTNITSIFPSISSSGSQVVSNGNITYIINPTNSPGFSPVPSNSVNLSDPSTKIAYFIIPKPSASTSNQIADSSTVTVPVQVNSDGLLQTGEQMMSEVIRNEVMDSSKQDSSIQIPLITSVTSLHDQTDVTSVISAEQSDDINTSENSNNTVVPVTTSSVDTSPIVQKDCSNALTSKAGPSVINSESPIIIYSDSSGDEQTGTSEMVSINDRNESDSAEEDLVIDENAVDKNTEADAANKEEKRGKIFVRNLTELLDPKTSSTGENEEETNKKNTKEKKEKKWNFPMKCDGCSVVFQRHRSMRSHYERKHKCLKCEFKCCKIGILKEHYFIKHKDYFCWRCSFFTENHSKFKEHCRTNHNCTTCNGTYSNLSTHVCPGKRQRDKSEGKSTDKLVSE